MVAAELKMRHCVAQAAFHYYFPRYNNGQSLFRPGDDVYVTARDYPRMKRKGKVYAVGEADETIAAHGVDVSDVFPRKSREIWIFGDGPTAMMAKGTPGKEAVVFGVNRCFYDKKTDGTPALALVPDYYVALDDYTMTQHEKQLKELSAVRKFTKRLNSRSGKWTWPELRVFDCIGEVGFSTDPLIVYHGKTSAYCALQLAVQCGLAYYPAAEITLHIAGIDLAVLRSSDGKIQTHQYGHGNYNSLAFTRMLTAIRYGLNHLNEIGIMWTNHSPLLADRIKDLTQ